MELKQRTNHDDGYNNSDPNKAIRTQKPPLAEKERAEWVGGLVLAHGRSYSLRRIKQVYYISARLVAVE